ncbi:hypothetical protein QQL45_08415 [Achromobacter insolitus]|uniref:hypothetical protein n=1 Tax=Achromobacter insolitus TaxID=217204 RepID=UPI00265B2012|nr:hypothetical protein [Achromobacter insolitus]WKK19320.1 hypothetical protein QQL45_08415 [Achromobacter insolitus]
MKRPSWIELLYLVAGPVIWLAHYLLIYPINAIACARHVLTDLWWGLPASSWIILAASLLALAGMAVIALHQYRRVRRHGLPPFHGGLTGMLCLLSAAAVAWETSAVFIAPPCG